MADRTNEERLQPSLLDRLTDDEPKGKVESLQKRVMSDAQLKASVVRDLTWLLNTQNLEFKDPFMRRYGLGWKPQGMSSPGSESDDSVGHASQPLKNFALARNSVINFGIPPLSGLTTSGIDIEELIRNLRDAIRNFEPRLMPDTLKVSEQPAGDAESPNTLSFVIEAELYSQPLPLHLYLVTSVDLATGQVEVSEAEGG